MSDLKNNLNGWLNINKEIGMTSREVVNVIQRTLNIKKVWLKTN